MLKHRVMFGLLLTAALVALFVLDDRLDSVRITGWLSELRGGRDTLPRGLVLFALSLVIAPLAAWELSRILRANGIRATVPITCLASVTGLVLSYSVPQATDGPTAIGITSSGLILVFVSSLAYYSRGRTVEGVCAAAAGTMFAMVYLGLLFGFFLAIRRDYSAYLVLGILAVTKSCDIGAYFTGTAIGRHKLAPWLSPGKTWEGLAGGVCTAVVIGTALAWVSGATDAVESVPIWLGAACGAVFAVAGQTGDLVASLFKRDAGIKDASSVLPGFGGVLDVIDSPLFVGPFAYWIFTIFPPV
ncbi:MAG: phosphatidate cytidylyltransferase [Phycisphaerales bacterium]|nr:phosphatidate cytidylyltransferase [Phycisphaerales bacterium]